VIYTKNQQMIELVSSLTANDMVDIRGVLCSQEVSKSTICGECGHKNTAPGNLIYVSPIYICRCEPGISPEKGLELLKERSEVSNMAFVIGTLCRDPVIYTNDKERSFAQYQLAVNRKYRIREDPPELKTDYPWVKTSGPQALRDAESLRTGAVVYINGSLQTRDVARKTVCANCGAEYDWQVSAMEIVPYSTEYISGCILPEPADRQDEEKIEKEGEATDAYEKCNR
jgi:hypothetical protein